MVTLQREAGFGIPVPGGVGVDIIVGSLVLGTGGLGFGIRCEQLECDAGLHLDKWEWYDADQEAKECECRCMREGCWCCIWFAVMVTTTGGDGGRVRIWECEELAG
jgi:hypothetical protein